MSLLGGHPGGNLASPGPRRRRSPVPEFLGPRQGIRGHLPGDVPDCRHRPVPGGRRTRLPRPRFHGRHQLNRWPDGLEKCIGCELCAWACPADAIYVEGADNTPDERYSPGERFGAVYQINYLRCILCGLCVEACPTRALTMTNEYELADDSRESLIWTSGAVARPAAARHGAAPARHASQPDRAGLLQPSARSRRRFAGDPSWPRGRKGRSESPAWTHRRDCQQETGPGQASFPTRPGCSSDARRRPGHQRRGVHRTQQINLLAARCGVGQRGARNDHGAQGRLLRGPCWPWSCVSLAEALYALQNAPFLGTSSSR